MPPEVSGRIRFLGFLMTAIVVLYHCEFPVDAPAAGPPDAVASRLISDLLERLATLAMGHFFAVTGFLLFRGLTFRNWPRKLRSRVFSLLVPYVLWQFLALLLRLARFAGDGVGDALSRIFLLGGWPPNGPLWYLYAAFALALLSPLLLLLFRGRPLWGWLGVLALCLGSMALRRCWDGAVLSLLSRGYVWNIAAYLPAYLIGSFYGAYAPAGDRPGALWYALSGVLLCAVLEPLLPGGTEEMGLQSLPMALLVLLPLPRRLWDRPVYRLGFLMYCLHRPLVDFACHRVRGLLARFTDSAAALNLCGRLAGLGLTLAAAWLLAAPLRRAAPRLLRLLTGGRTF